MAKGVRVITNSPANDFIVLLESSPGGSVSRVQWTPGISHLRSYCCFSFFFCRCFQFFLFTLVIWSQSAGLGGTWLGLSPTAASSKFDRVVEQV